MLAGTVSCLFHLPMMIWHRVELGKTVATVETLPDIHLEMVWHQLQNDHNTPSTVFVLFGCSCDKFSHIFQLSKNKRSRDCPCIAVNYESLFQANYESVVLDIDR